MKNINNRMGVLNGIAEIDHFTDLEVTVMVTGWLGQLGQDGVCGQEYPSFHC